ncbi:hypothetical protein BBK36DRAFT_1110715 [Trichoderma citrinoviride]|uniref:Gastric mucin-like protein n=1 Tax=Trichoderma citrinoviride TaxID=58853 RepID=A0A2T4BL69_9HYPO|nr:hypothetical protein BBK36DRAFT_1110715 [Trichoderma citrinoviride]PTB70053.1 hypothetical protein BBK36DRAFT_1110715 [Trichoderma citrinoviride]
MADTRMDEYGSVVAFEGPLDVVSTQLRLLPTSPQILILPAIQHYIPSNDSDKAFEVRAYVRKVHDALSARHEAARCFLHGATTSNKRLAFLNGGTPSAHALCIKAIMKHETSGDRVEAEAVYAQLAKDGLAGLEAKSQIHSHAISGDAATFNEEFNDPITRAMRAADDLDRQTANLQPHDLLDLAATTRPRSLSLPLYGYSDGFGDAAPFFLFGAQVEDEEAMDDDGPLTPEAPTFAAVDYNRPSKRLMLDSAEIRPASPCGVVHKSPVSSSLRVSRDIEMLSPRSELLNAGTHDRRGSGDSMTHDLRASVGSSKGAPHRVRSLDRIYPLSAKLRDLCISEASAEMEAEPNAARRSQSFMVSGEEEPTLIRRISYIDRRRTVRSKGRQPSIKVDQNLLDRKTRKGHNTIGAFPGTEEPFQPLLPWVEDLVVYFKDETPSPLLSSIIKSFKAGNYPILSSSSYSPIIPGATTLHQPTALDQRYHDRAHETSVLNTAADDDDLNPFTHIREVHPPKRIVPTVNVVRPPTPAQTPPPCIAKEDKFYDLEIISGQTAVAIQNSLRSILSKYFSPESEGYRQFQFSLLPEFGGMWKPVFRETESRHSQKEPNRRVDPILAIGSQQGVDKVYSSGIVKRLESIGTKSSDRQGRSGRVDFRRYLLANAMQAFTALPLTNQTSDNPFTNSYLLATLLIPHLESYLALHPEIRYLLLEYPPEHLPTILALQKLAGVEFIKVAQIVDPNKPDRLPFTQIGGPAIGAKADAKTPSLSPQASSTDITVSNANFLLASTATDKDIAKFISTVWNIHVEDGVSGSPPRKQTSPDRNSRKSRPAPLDALFTRFSMSTELEPSPTSAEASSSPGSLTLSSRRPSFTDNLMTPQSDTVQSREFTRRQLRGDVLSMATFDSADTELDLEERRLMPMFMKPAEPKNNTRKALKFLGLE